jgi:hypothetical protein
LRGEHKLFENRVLRKIFGPKKDEVTGKWRKLHNEKLYDLYFSPVCTVLLSPGVNPIAVKYVYHILYIISYQILFG